MTPEQQRVAIPKALGWHTIQRNPLYPDDSSKIAGFHSGDFTALYGIPDYLNDLNACHEMEKVLDEDQQEVFLMYLGAYDHDSDAGWNAFHATAAQRCEAFLRTLGLWQEGEKS